MEAVLLAWRNFRFSAGEAVAGKVWTNDFQGPAGCSTVCLGRVKWSLPSLWSNRAMDLSKDTDWYKSNCKRYGAKLTFTNTSEMYTLTLRAGVPFKEIWMSMVSAVWLHVNSAEMGMVWRSSLHAAVVLVFEKWQTFYFEFLRTPKKSWKSPRLKIIGSDKVKETQMSPQMKLKYLWFLYSITLVVPATVHSHTVETLVQQATTNTRVYYQDMCITLFLSTISPF
jgi:hypothetical protein